MRIIDSTDIIIKTSMDELRAEFPSMVIRHGLVYEDKPSKCCGPTFRILVGEP